ncbi:PLASMODESMATA CALLOSE-BINDING PROTEIN 5 [Forsythia ovata]|uniref:PLASMODESMATA CALLOSE-BINDING PROTEIN 5 n=1 Tax=Forsythia ovata TaxID=205694 RepID=A0ABD1R4N2_9LAMI
MASRIISLALFFFFSYIAATFAAQGGGGGGATVELWCVAKNNAEDAALQPALDWACGPGGADCRPIQNNGPCYDQSDLQRTASFAFNDYFLRHGLTEDSCNFSNTAALTSLNPSHNNCKFPSSLSTSSGGSYRVGDSRES